MFKIGTVSKLLLKIIIMKQLFISHLLYAGDHSKYFLAMVHLILTKIARKCNVSIVQMRKLTFKELKNQVANLELKFRSIDGTAFNNLSKNVSPPNECLCSRLLENSSNLEA